jgi:uncharacterized protein
LGSPFFILEGLTMIAVFVNCGAIIIGTLIGFLAARKISSGLSEIIQTAAGIITSVIGIQMALKYHSIVYLALSLILGGIIGTWWDIDGKILSAGKMLERTLYHKTVLAASDGASKQSFAYAFLNASVLFCVGAMAILGSFKAGIEKDYTIIFTKSILDGFMALTFGAAMGIGTAFSALSVLLYQGMLTLLSVLLQPFVTEEMIAEVTGTGGALIMMIGINLLGLKKIKTANYLPAVLLSVLFVVLEPGIKQLFHV